MDHRVLLGVLLMSVVSAPLARAQTHVLADTVWVAPTQLGVGKALSVTFADAAARSAFPRDEAPLATVDGKAWRLEDILVSVDMGIRAPSTTWLVAGPREVVAAFEASLRRRAAAASVARTLRARTLVVRCACEQ